MKRPAALLIIAFGCGISPGVLAQQEIGRLFLTPEQRSALDARRKARVPDKPAAALESSFARLDGFVRRSGGPSTAFVNGEPIPSGVPTEGMRAAPNRTDPSRVSISAGETEKPVELRVGQTLERITGGISDVIGGEIRVTPRQAPKRAP